MIEKGADLNPSTTLGSPLVSPEFGAGNRGMPWCHRPVSTAYFDLAGIL
jgi:hypothetical protein